MNIYIQGEKQDKSLERFFWKIGHGRFAIITGIDISVDKKLIHVDGVYRPFISWEYRDKVFVIEWAFWKPKSTVWAFMPYWPYFQVVHTGEAELEDV